MKQRAHLATYDPSTDAIYIRLVKPQENLDLSVGELRRRGFSYYALRRVFRAEWSAERAQYARKVSGQHCLPLELEPLTGQPHLQVEGPRLGKLRKKLLGGAGDWSREAPRELAPRDHQLCDGVLRAKVRDLRASIQRHQHVLNHFDDCRKMWRDIKAAPKKDRHGMIMVAIEARTPTKEQFCHQDTWVILKGKDPRYSGRKNLLKDLVKLNLAHYSPKKRRVLSGKIMHEAARSIYFARLIKERPYMGVVTVPLVRRFAMQFGAEDAVVTARPEPEGVIELHCKRPLPESFGIMAPDRESVRGMASDSEGWARLFHDLRYVPKVATEEQHGWWVTKTNKK